MKNVSQLDNNDHLLFICFALFVVNHIYDMLKYLTMNFNFHLHFLFHVKHFIAEFNLLNLKI